MARQGITTIQVEQETRDLLRAYLFEQQAKTGRKMSYDEVLKELLSLVGLRKVKR